MKYKVGNKVNFVKDYTLETGKVISANSVWEVKNVLDAHYRLERVVGNQLVVLMIERKIAEDYCEKINNELSITKQMDEKHNILNWLNNTDDSVDGEKVASNSEEAKTKGSHYERASMQPLEVMQRLMTEEQFKGFLLGNCIKYRMRSQYKGQHDSDEYKARQYAYWLELADMGQTINPSEDKVPNSYKFKVV